MQAQLKLAMGYTFAQLGLGDVGLDTPKACAIQLRLCAEDPSNQFALSVGKVTEMVCSKWPWCESRYPYSCCWGEPCCGRSAVGQFTR